MLSILICSKDRPPCPAASKRLTHLTSPHARFILKPFPSLCASFLRDHDVSQINYMYAQYVKNTMQPLNIGDVTKDQRFPWTVCTPFFPFVSFSLCSHGE